MKKMLIVTEHEYDVILFSFKEKNPFASIKIIHPDQFISLLSYSYKKDPIPYLLTLGYDFAHAFKVMRILIVGELSKNEKLYNLFLDLKNKDYFEINPYGKYEIEHSDLYFFEMDEDIELHALATRNNVSYTNLSIADLKIEMKFPEDKKHPPLFSFKNKFQQFFYIYSDIRARLLNGEDPSKIKIHIFDETDLFYVKLCSSLFGVASYADETHSLMSEKEVSEKLKVFYKNESFEISDEEKEVTSLNLLSDVIDYYKLKELPFNKAYSSLIEIITSIVTTSKTDNKGIGVCKDYIIDLNSSTYVTDFTDGSFYEVFTDDNVCSDEELIKMSVNPSYVLTALDRRKKLNYLRYGDIKILSLIEEHLSDHIYSSQFCSEIPLYKNIKANRSALNKDGIYTSKAKTLWQGKELDDAFYYKKYNEFRSYDHHYKKIEGFKADLDKKTLSVTDLESYISCPFSYLMYFLLPVNNGDYHSLYYGILVHKIMEHVYDDDFSFDKAFNEGKEAYLNSMKNNNQNFSATEEAYLKIYYHHLKRIVSELRSWKSFSSIKKDFSEQKIEWNLYSEDKTYHFRGRIDKIIEFGKDNSNSYYYLVDYKSGSESFIIENVRFGRNIQLPLYYYALNENKKLREQLVGDASFGGFGIQQINPDSIKKAYGKDCKLIENVFYKYSSFKGVSLSTTNSDYWHLADETAFVDKNGKLVIDKRSSLYMSTSGSFESSDVGSILGKNECVYTFNDLIYDAINATLATIKKIEDGIFDIAPTVRGDLSKRPKAIDLSCKYCPYKDICYRNMTEDYNDLSDEVHEYFALEEDFDDEQ